MATQTTNYHLIKPEYADDADIADINTNMDTLDTTLASQSAAIANQVLTVSSAISIPASGSSVSKTMSGLTADHQLVRWNFSSSAENNPPVSLTWSTTANGFTISNTGGSTSETIKPVFAKPTALAAT